MDDQARHEHLAALDRAHVWHPFTQMSTWLDPLPGDEPLIIDHAIGCWLFDRRVRTMTMAVRYNLTGVPASGPVI